MARAIDADRLADGLELHRQPTDQKHEADRQWAVGYNAGLDRALYSIAYVPTLTQPNEPLTLDELREMSGQPFWDDAGSVWWIVAHVDGSKIYTEEGAILDFYEEGEEDIYFRRPPEGEEETP